ncbi:hypothetical protein LTR95_005913 [Oleoguttula sp. CCFEE 5521]
MEAFPTPANTIPHFDKLSRELRDLVYANCRATDATVYVHAQPVFGSDSSPAVLFTSHLSPLVGLCGVNKQYRIEYLDHFVTNFCKTQVATRIEVHVVDLDFTHITALLQQTMIQHRVCISLTFTKPFIRTALDLATLRTFLDNKAQLPVFAAGTFTWRICQVGDCTKTLDPVDGLKDVLTLNTALNDIDWADRLRLPPDLDALINATSAFNKPLYVQNDPESYKTVDPCDDPMSFWWTFRHVENKHQLYESGPPIETMTPAVQKYLHEWHEVLMENCQGHGMPGMAPLPFPAFPSNSNEQFAERRGVTGAVDRGGSEDQDVHVSEWDLQQSADRMEQELQEHNVEVKTDEDEGRSIKVEDESVSTEAEHGE